MAHVICCLSETSHFYFRSQLDSRPQLLPRRLKIVTHNLAATEAGVLGAVPRAPTRPRLGVYSQEGTARSRETGGCQR